MWHMHVVLDRQSSVRHVSCQRFRVSTGDFLSPVKDKLTYRARGQRRGIEHCGQLERRSVVYEVGGVRTPFHYIWGHN